MRRGVEIDSYEARWFETHNMAIYLEMTAASVGAVRRTPGEKTPFVRTHIGWITGTTYLLPA